MQVNEQLHGPAALHPVKQIIIPTHYDIEWGLKNGVNAVEKKVKISCPC
jgi:hypothetical protein